MKIDLEELNKKIFNFLLLITMISSILALIIMIVYLFKMLFI